MREWLANHQGNGVPLLGVTIPPRTEPTADEISSTADRIAIYRAVDEHWDLQFKAWWQRHERSWRRIGLLILLPVAAAVVFYFIGLPALVGLGLWSKRGSRSPIECR